MHVRYQSTLSLGCHFVTISSIWWFVIIILIITIPISPLSSQRVHHLDIHNGLCTNSLTDLTLDRQGNMWIGSYSGLMKYSGTHIKCLTSVGNDRHSISGPEMHSVTEDHCGFIWIGTTAGLDKINPVTFEVEHYPVKSPFPGSSSVGYIYAVHADRYDFLWFSTDVALFRLDINTGQYEALPTEKNEYSVPDGAVLYNGFLEVEDGLWISLTDGMTFFEFKTQKFYHRYHNPHKKSIFNAARKTANYQSDLEQDAKGKIWFVYENHWLASYDIATDKMDTFRFQQPKGTWLCCWSIGVDAQENIWIGTRHGGIFIFNRTTQTFNPLKNDGINRLIQSDYIYSIERGPDGQMFVAHDNGLDIVDLYDLSLRERTMSGRADFTNLKYEGSELSLDLNEQSLYIPFFKFGFFRYDLQRDSFSEFKTVNYLGGGVSLVQKIQDKTFVGIKRNLYEVQIMDTLLNVLEVSLLPDSISLENGQVTWYYQQSPNSTYLKKSNGRIYHINDGNIEILSGIGFKPNLCLSPDSQYLNYLTPQLNLVRRKFNPVRDDTINLQRHLGNTNFSFSNPRHMTDDGSSVWMTGQNGILRYDYTHDQLHHYGVDKGLSHSFTFSVVQDTHRRVWVGSIGGIDRYDSESDRFISIYKMKENTYMSAFGDAVCSKQGDLFFQFGNKLIYLHSDKVRTRLNDSISVRLHEVKVNGQNIDWFANQRLDHLRHFENRLTFIYDVLLYDDSDLVSFEYRLNGNDWISNEKRNEINLAGLSSGNYLLEVRCLVGALSNGIRAVSIPFSIHPPWWKQWWFYLLLFIISITALWLYFKGRINKYRQELLVARQITDLESKALRAQMNPHFVFNSLNAIQECIVTGRVDEAYTYLSKFSRLLRLVLEHSDTGEVSLHDELEVLDLYISLEKLRFKNDMHYQFELNEELDPEEIMIPPMLIQPHIENAIWHGLRHKQGEKHLRLSINEAIPGYLEVVIEDNGIGRKKSALISKNRIGGATHKSKGKQLSANRMEIFRKAYPLTSMIITDLEDRQGESEGTRITLRIPMLVKSTGNTN